MWLLVLGAGFFIGGSPILTSRAQSVTSQSERFDALVHTETEKGQNVATAVAVVFQGQIVYAKAIGLANFETQQPISLDSVWRSPALSHAYNDVVFAALSSEGLLDLNKPVGTYWPELNQQVGRATVRQLAVNRGGIKDEHLDYPLWDFANPGKYALSFDASSVIAEPGYVWSYSSPSGNLAAAVAQHVSGKGFDTLLESCVFRPMGFSRTSLSILQIATQPIAQGHQKGPAGWEVVRPLGQNQVGWPNSIFTSASEAISFLGALVDEGQWQGRQVLAKPVVAETRALLKDADGNPERPEPGGNIAQATSWAGVVTAYSLSPDKRFGVLVFTSGSGESVRALVSGAKTIWLREPQKLVETTAALRAIPLTEEQAAGLVGTYRNESIIQLQWRDGSLMFHMEGPSWLPPSDWTRVKRISDDQYTLDKPYGADLRLVRAANGTVTHVFYGGRAYHKEGASRGPTDK